MATQRIDPDHNLRRAAILVASLDGPAADRVLDQLPAEDAARVRRMMVELDEIDQHEQQRVIGEFVRSRPAVLAASRPASTLPRGVELDAGLARRLSLEGYAAKTAGTSPAPFRFLHEAQSDTISPVLSGEHPQTIALVVSHLPDERAASLLATLEGELQADVIRRLMSLDQTDPDILREVERGLESRLLEQTQVERRRDAGLASVARMLEAAAPSVRRAILANLAAHDRRLAGRLRSPSLRFEDLQRLDDEALAAVLAAAEPEVARLALAGAGPALVDRVLSQLQPAEARKVRRMIERLGPTRLSDVEEAQAELARIAHSMVLEGRIDLPTQTPMLVGANR
ncbi:MAG TPA: FliG C-terminal domain-containing protein [Pirellulales bacterium]